MSLNRAVPSSAWWTLKALAILLPALVVLSGCLSRPGLVSQSFTFFTPAAQGSQTNANAGSILAVRRLAVAAPFAGQSFVYRTGASSYEQDPYAQFLVPPEESLAEPVRAYLRNTGRFRAVTEAGSFRQPDILLEISVPQLYGDFRNRAAPAAVLSMRLVFLSASGRPHGRVLAEKTFTRRVPLKARTATALMAGWNEAVKDIMAESVSMPLTSTAHE